MSNLVYIDALTKGLTSAVNLFADDMSLFAVVHDLERTSISLNEDLTKTSQQSYQWKLLFNPDTSKEDQEIIFFHKKALPIMQLFISNIWQ